MRWYAALVGVLVAAALAVAWLTSRGVPDGLSDLRPTPVPVDVEVIASQVDYDAAGKLTATRLSGTPLLTSGLAGTVTEVAVQVGEDLAPGMVLYSVNGIQVRAYTGEVMYRPLSRGVSGPDVVAAQKLLAAVDASWQVSPTGTVDQVTERAIAAYGKLTGAGKDVTALDQAWFVRLPSERYTVRSLELQAGAPAPAGGSVSATTDATFTQVILSSDSAGPDGDYHFVASGQTFPVTRQGKTWTLTDDAELTALLAASSQAGDGSAISIEGRTRLAVPEAGVAVPGASLVTNHAGRQCVFLASSPANPVPVTVLGSDVTGLAQLDDAAMQVGTRILVNPLTVFPSVQCP